MRIAERTLARAKVVDRSAIQRMCELTRSG